jgi:hypothetical protein
MDMMNITDIRRNMARRVAQTIQRNGEAKKERVIKLLNNVLM